MITITIDTDNAAFEDDFESEIVAILNKVKGRILKEIRDPEASGDRSFKIRDSNGNTIGTCLLEE